ncbi:MAG: hypothetical protein LCH73_14705 [Proteobacteria bacterium]|nr:hypothetical protein [Pseudomonadota bacterium]
MQSIRHTLTALALAALGASAFAQAVAPAATASAPRTFAERQAQQQQRIDNGMQSGQINTQEAQRLQTEQQAIQKAQQKANADGVVTAKEQKRLNRMQDGASKDIHQQRHDQQAMPGVTPNANAGANNHGDDPNHYNRRKETQDARIDAGMQSGAINEREAKRLHAEQQVIKDAHQDARADGVVTKTERKNLNTMQDAASKDIHRQRHDKQKKKTKD